MLELFFAMFYASVNVGAVLCMWFIPMVRSKSSFYGDSFECSNRYKDKNCEGKMCFFMRFRG